jgi:DNA-binding transcriptional ArsR family regulator
MGVVMTAEYKKLLEDKAEILKALSHPIRLCIVKNLVETGGCNVSKMQGCLDMPQSTVSQHLSKLKSLRIIEGQRNGTEIVYHAIDGDAIKIVNTLIP